MKRNYKQILSIISLCERLGVSKVSFLRLVLQGRAVDNKMDILLSDDEFEDVKILINRYYKAHPNKIRVGIPFSACTIKKNCLAGTDKLNIRYDGNVYPCEAFKNGEPQILSSYQPANIYNQSLSSIYFSSKYLEDIRSRLVKFQLVETCETCINQYYRKNNKL